MHYENVTQYRVYTRGLEATLDAGGGREGGGGEGGTIPDHAQLGAAYI